MKDKFISSDLFKSFGIKICFCDIGASEGLGGPWKLLDEGIITTIGFEPDKKEYEKLVAKYPDSTYYNIGLWSEPCTRNYYLTQQDYYNDFKHGTSGMYPPNVPKISLNYGDIDKGRAVEKIVKVPCDALDNVLGNNPVIPDFVKMDTQGAEYEILKGARGLLSQNAPIVTLETWNEDIYKDVPLVHKVMALMDEYGYQLYKTAIAVGRFYATDKSVHCISRDSGHELFYVKKYDQMHMMTDEQLIKQIAILEVFGFRDYSVFLAKNLKIINEKTAAKILDNLYTNGQNMNQEYAKIRY
ncbi:FkbM family methyltransferase [Alteromonas sediminis]|nr:FkbM family methyltransferase [Alteromonas sediminis]